MSHHSDKLIAQGQLPIHQMVHRVVLDMLQLFSIGQGIFGWYSHIRLQTTFSSGHF